MAQTNITDTSVSGIKTAPNGVDYTDIGDIRKDIDSLKSSMVSLSRHLQRGGKAKADEVRGALSDGLETILGKGDASLLKVEEQVRENPRRSIVIAFMAGFALNFLLRR